MMVIGIDPGLTRCGYGVVLQNGSAVEAIAMGVISTDKDSPTHSRLAQLHQDISEIITEFNPEVMALERVFIELNRKSGTATTQAAGVAMTIGSLNNCEIREYSPKQIKKAVTNYGSADKAQVNEMVKTLLGIQEDIQPVDVSDALAVALCYLAQAPKLEVK